MCRSRDRGFRDPNTGGARLAPTDVVRKSLSNKNAALATTINRTGLNIQQKSLGENTKHINFYASCLLLSSCLLKKPSFATSACRKGPHPSTSFCGHQPKLSLKGWGIAVTEIHFKIVPISPIYHLACKKTSVNNEISTTNLNWLATAGCLPSIQWFLSGSTLVDLSNLSTSKPSGHFFCDHIFFLQFPRGFGPLPGKGVRGFRGQTVLV